MHLTVLWGTKQAQSRRRDSCGGNAEKWLNHDMLRFLKTIRKYGGLSKVYADRWIEVIISLLQAFQSRLVIAYLEEWVSH
jgi:hypothetical protein